MYDVSFFLDEHPGTPETILDNAGGDVTDFFEDVGGTSMVETFRQNRVGEVRMQPSAWHNMSRE